MLRENRSETDELRRLIAAKDTELATERNVRELILYVQISLHLPFLFFSIVYNSKNNFDNN